MKNKTCRIALAFALALACLFLVSSCDMRADEPLIGGDPLSRDVADGGEDYESVGRLFFTDGKDRALLLSDDGLLLWLYSEDEGAFESYDVGDLVSVSYGMVMKSFPGQTYITEIALIEEGSTDSFTEDEKERIAAVAGKKFE